MLQKSIEKIRWQYVTCDNISQKNLVVLELKKSTIIIANSSSYLWKYDTRQFVVTYALGKRSSDSKHFTLLKIALNQYFLDHCF